jgi:hypothetical protein
MILVPVVLSGGVPPVDGQAGSGDETRARAGQVGQGIGDLVPLRIALQRNVFFCLRRELSRGRIHIGIRRSKLDIVDRDAARPQVARQRFRQPCDGGFGQHIERPAAIRHVCAVDAADVDPRLPNRCCVGRRIEGRGSGGQPAMTLARVKSPSRKKYNVP